MNIHNKLIKHSNFLQVRKRHNSFDYINRILYYSIIILEALYDAMMPYHKNELKTHNDASKIN